MTATSIPAAGPRRRAPADLGPRPAGPRPGVCEVDEPSGTWTGLACPDHGLAPGADVDTATVRQLAARGQLADLIWEAPADLTAEHGQLLRAAIQAYHAGRAEAARQLWQHVRAVWSRA